MDAIVLKYPISADDFTRAGEASSDVKSKLKQMGVSPEAVRKVAIAMYEGEINMVIHAKGGEITVEITPENIRMILADVGPGIPDIDLAMKAGYSTAPDEVRSLASKSAEAAKGTGELIDQCLQAIENGNQVAGDTATALNSIKESVDMVAAHTGEISDMAAEQSDMVLNIHNEIESVSQVVQMTAASAQESSSTSRMLQQQAEQLRALSRSKTGPASV